MINISSDVLVIDGVRMTSPPMIGQMFDYPALLLGVMMTVIRCKGN